jgi:tetratricopeptide (TPR) repeat protein
MTSDPYDPHLRQAEVFFIRGEIVKAGQIWQAILKQQPTHAKAREGLMAVKQRLLALREAEATTAHAPSESLPLASPDSAERLAPAPPPPPSTPAVTPVEVLATPFVAPPPSLPRPERASLTVARPDSMSQVAHFLIRSLDVPLYPAPGRVVTGSLDPDRLVAEGCTLYDMGQIEDALRKWDRALAMDPTHTLARSYANGARRELGLDPVPATTFEAPSQVETYSAGEDVDNLLREAVQLYDMGLVEEAIPKWERVLVLEPHRHEVEGYLKMARGELGRDLVHASTVSPNDAVPEVETLELRLKQAEHLLHLQRHEEAAFTYQQALRLSPGDPRALLGLERCRKPSEPARDSGIALHSFTPVMALDTLGRIAVVDQDTRSPLPTEGQGIQPPAALLMAAPVPRVGLSVPDRVRLATGRMPWLRETKLLAILSGSLLALLVGVAFFQGYRRDQALKEDVRAAREAAVAPLGQQMQAPDLSESADALREEAEGTLLTDPLRAFLRAEALVNLNSKDAAGAQLLEKARAALPGGVSGPSLPEFQKHLQNGDLEAAYKVIDALLRAKPSSTELRTRAARLHLALCTAHAAQAKWDEAREDLLRGRALFPGDKTWQIRLKLLEYVKAQPKDQQGLWIALLG